MRLTRAMENDAKREEELTNQQQELVEGKFNVHMNVICSSV